MTNSISSSSSTSYYKNILSDEGYKQLKFIKYYSNSNLTDDVNSNMCPIIGVVFKDNDAIIQLPCSHYFEPESILKWVKEKNAECPICRFKLKSIEVKNEPAGSAESAEPADNISNFLLNLYKRNALLNTINDILTNDNIIAITDANADADADVDVDVDADDTENKIKASYEFMQEEYETDSFDDDDDDD